MLALRLPPEIERRLDTLARKTGRTKSYYAREAILRHIEDMEDRHLAAARRKASGRRTPPKKRARPMPDLDTAWRRSLSATLGEWSTPEDAAAYDDL